MQRPDPADRIDHGARIRLGAAGTKNGFRGRLLGLAGVGALTALAVLTTLVPGPSQVQAHAADRGPATVAQAGPFRQPDPRAGTDFR